MEEVAISNRLTTREDPHDAVGLRLVANKYLEFRRAFLDEKDPTAMEKKRVAFQETLKDYEFFVRKVAVAAEGLHVEKLAYEKQRNADAERIELASKEIDQLKAELKHQQKLRRHKEEYEAVANVIKTLPSRTKSEGEIAVLEDEIETLRKRNSEVDQRLQLRQKQFQLLLHTLADVERDLDELDDEKMVADMKKEEEEEKQKMRLDDDAEEGEEREEGEEVASAEKSEATPMEEDELEEGEA
uniref:THO complex subunit 7 homolog n=1 Tax=Palpitomonas bilix TaxID=652834 RepID=A0A7S3FYZ3_9EUKA|mmetsp:Transcript_11361/g.30049  ORF Transcript_11361/g.30049 Transcript_11361/m.30049 type:complete len:243 (+) Transcript_11361:227-955(+)